LQQTVAIAQELQASVEVFKVDAEHLPEWLEDLAQ
jgi:hypothetical protein